MFSRKSDAKLSEELEPFNQQENYFLRDCPVLTLVRLFGGNSNLQMKFRINSPKFRSPSHKHEHKNKLFAFNLLRCLKVEMSDR